MKRKLISVCAIILSLCMLAACGSSSTPDTGSGTTQQTTAASTEQTTPKTDEKVELRLSWWGSETRHELTMKAIDAYCEANPNVTIIPEYSGYDGYQDKLTAQIVAGNAPDVFTAVAEWVPQHAASKATLDLTTMINTSGINKAALESCSLNGVLHSVPLGINAPTVVYNKRILEEIGVELPKSGYTWDDFAAKCVEIHQKSGGKYYGTIDSGAIYTNFDKFAYTYLAKEAPYPYDNEKTYYTQEDIAAYYQYFKDLRATGALVPTDLSISKGLDLIYDTAAFVFVWSSTFEQYQNESKDELGMIMIPQGKNGERAETARPPMTFSIFSGTKYPEAAAKFVDWFVNSDDAAKILNTCRGVFATESQRNVLLNTDGALNDVSTKVFNITNEAMSGEIKPFYGGPTGISNLFMDGGILESVGQEIAFNKISVEEGAAKFMTEAQKVLDAAK